MPAASVFVLGVLLVTSTGHATVPRPLTLCASDAERDDGAPCHGVETCDVAAGSF